MAEDEINIEDEAIALEDAEDTSITDTGVSSIVDHVVASFKKSEDYRYEDEQRWIRAYRNYSFVTRRSQKITFFYFRKCYFNAFLFFRPRDPSKLQHVVRINLVQFSAPELH